MERSKYWYSVISYQPDKMKNEKLNVGLIIHNPENEFLKWFILDEKNRKLKSYLTNSVLIEEFKVRKTLFDFKLEKSLKEQTLMTYQINDEKLFDYINIDNNGYFSLSKKQLIISSNINSIFQKLLETYIDRVFLDKEISSKGVKHQVRHAFEQYHLLGVKVKSDVTITPVKELDINYKIDFVYKNTEIHFVQAVPSNLNNINEWFSKMKLLQSEYSGNHQLEIIYNERLHTDPDDMTSILSYLNRNQSTEIIKIESPDFNRFCKHISEESVSIKELEEELIAI